MTSEHTWTHSNSKHCLGHTHYEFIEPPFNHSLQFYMYMQSSASTDDAEPKRKKEHYLSILILTQTVVTRLDMLLDQGLESITLDIYAIIIIIIIRLPYSYVIDCDSWIEIMTEMPQATPV